MFTRIDRTNKGVTGLPDTPNLSTSEMQEKFDELGVMACDGVNTLIDELEASGAENTGIMPPPGYTGDPNIQAFADDVYQKVTTAAETAHTHDNKSVLDTLTQALIGGISRLAGLFVNINTIGNSVIDSSQAVPTSHAIVDYVQRMGGGDMTQTRYDSDGDGKVNASVNADHATEADHAQNASNAVNAESATSASTATMADDAVTMGGNALSYEGGSFYIRNGNVKKKLGSGGRDSWILIGEVTGSSGDTAEFNVSGYSDYQSLTEDNFVVVPLFIGAFAAKASETTTGTSSTNMTVLNMSQVANTSELSIAYNAPTVTISGLICNATERASALSRSTTNITRYVKSYIVGKVYLIP